MNLYVTVLHSELKVNGRYLSGLVVNSTVPTFAMMSPKFSARQTSLLWLVKFVRLMSACPKIMQI